MKYIVSMIRILYECILLSIVLFGVIRAYSQTEQNCPKLELVGPAGLIGPEDPVEFRVGSKEGLDLSSIKVKWTVSVGRIVSGDGTPKITFSSERSNAGKVKVTAKVMNLPSDCGSMLLDEWGVMPPIGDPIVDSFGKTSRNDLQARIDNIYAQLNSNPTYEGLLILRFPEKTTAAYKTSRVKLFLQCLKYRKYDQTRVSFYLDSESGDEETRVLIGQTFDDYHFEPSRLIKAEEIASKLKELFLSDIRGVAELPPSDPLDTFGKQSLNDIKARMDNFYSSLLQNPNCEGVLEMRFGKDARASYKVSRVKLILQAINFRQYDLTRVSFYFTPESKFEETIVWILPPGARSDFDQSKLIKAEEISSKLNGLFH